MLGRRASRLAPPRHGAVRGLASRVPRAHRHYTRALSSALPVRRDGRPPGLPARALPPLHPRISRTLPTRRAPRRALRRALRSCPAPRPLATPRAAAPAPRPMPRLTLVSRCRAPRSCPVAVGRDVPIAPPRHRRGAWLGIPRPSCAPSLHTRITQRIARAARWGHRALPPLHPRISRALPTRRAPSPPPRRTRAAAPHCPWWPKPLKAEHRRLPDSEYIDAKKTFRCCILSRNAPQEETVAVEQNKKDAHKPPDGSFACTPPFPSQHSQLHPAVPKRGRKRQTPCSRMLHR